MDEMYRMLGRERRADLDREALKWQRATKLRKRPAIALGIWRAVVMRGGNNLCRDGTNGQRQRRHLSRPPRVIESEWL
jgi:hypothetical protein